MSNKSIFTEEDLAAFKELGNVGAGHAAIALTKLFSREVDMSIPFVRVGSAEEILKMLEMTPNELVGYELVDVDDPVKYRLSVVFRTSVIIQLLKLLSTTTKESIDNKDDMTEMQKSLIQEIGSTIILRYIAAINKMMKVESLPEDAPTFYVGEAHEALEKISYSENENEIILIQLDLFTDENKFEAMMYIQPHPDSLDAYRKAFHIS